MTSKVEGKRKLPQTKPKKLTRAERLAAELAAIEKVTRSGRIKRDNLRAAAAIAMGRRLAALQQSDPDAATVALAAERIGAESATAKPDERLRRAGIEGPGGQLVLIPPGSSFAAERARLLRGGWGPGGYAFGSR